MDYHVEGLKFDPLVRANVYTIYVNINYEFWIGAKQIRKEMGSGFAPS